MKGRRHRPACRHCYRVRLLGRDYWTWRASWEAQLEAVAAGYPAESKEFRAGSPAPTFGRFLVQMAGSGWPMSGRPPRRTFATSARYGS